jgi:D-alanyl-lipoteichoic acid acyltransferase DltB (MBOAT superfamily)
LEVSRKWAASHFYNAWALILMGLFKKIVVANTVKVFVDQIFLQKEPSKLLLVVGGLGFTLQILADFSSYTDLSRGLSFLLGLETTENFNKPYLSLTPGEFWNRWHISFSSWLRDYVFFPLRRILLRVRNLPENLSLIIPPLVTMFISGLWHGTGLTFVAWGLYYGVLIVVYQLMGFHGNWKPAGVLKHLAAWLVMFAIIVFGWIIFRAQSMPWLWGILLHSPLYHDSGELVTSLVLTEMIAFYAALLIIKHVLDTYCPKWANLHALYYVAATLLIIIYINSASPDFIYFQF